MPEYEVNDEGEAVGSVPYRTVSGERRFTAKATAAKQVLAYPSITPPVPVPTALDSTYISDITEAAQDAVGAMLVDGTTIDFTYTDATPSLTAEVKAASLDNTYMANRTRSIEITKFVLQSGTPDEAVRGTNLRYSAWAFDAAATEGIVTPTFQVPRDWASGALLVFLHWTNLGAGSGNVLWDIAMNEKADAADLNSTSGDVTTQSVIAAPAQNIHKISQHGVAFTPSAAGVHVVLRIARVGGDATDTLANDAGLLKVQITYTADM